MIDPNGMWAGQRPKDVPHNYTDGGNGGGGDGWKEPGEPQWIPSQASWGSYTNPANRYRPKELGPTKEQVDAWFETGAHKSGVSLNDFLSGNAVDITGNGDWVSRDEIAFTTVGDITSFGFAFDGNGNFSINIESESTGANITWNATKTKMYVNSDVSVSFASSGGDNFGEGLDGPILTGNLNAYYGFGGLVGGELFGEKSYFGLHLLTVQRTLSTKSTLGSYETKNMYSGFEFGVGPLSYSLKYSWTSNKLSMGGGFGMLGVQSGQTPTLDLTSGTLYLGVGVGGSLSGDLGLMMKAQTQYDRALRYYWGKHYNAAAYKKW